MEVEETSVQRPILGVYGLTYQYGQSHVLEEVSFELGHGEILALLGPNGCGKSTLLKVIAGLLPARRKGCSGQVFYRGQDFFCFDQAARARSIAYVAPAIRAEFPMTAEEAVTLGLTSRGIGKGLADRELVTRAMERCCCWGLRNRDLHTLSGGERQLIALARALVQGARVLLLDEALSQMDLNHQAAVGKMLRGVAKEEGCSMILVSHDVNLASEWADSGLLLRRGERVASGPVREVLNAENLRKIYPGSDLVVGTNPVTGAPKVFFGAGESREDRR